MYPNDAHNSESKNKEVHVQVHHKPLVCQSPADYGHYLMGEGEDAYSKQISPCKENKVPPAMVDKDKEPHADRQNSE